MLRLVQVDGRSGDPRLDADVLRARPGHEYMHDMHEENALERGKGPCDNNRPLTFGALRMQVHTYDPLPLFLSTRGPSIDLFPAGYPADTHASRESNGAHAVLLSLPSRQVAQVFPAHGS